MVSKNYLMYIFLFAGVQLNAVSPLATEAALTGGLGLLQGVGSQVGKPVGEAVQRLFNPFLHPMRTLTRMNLALYQGNPDALSFEIIVSMQQTIDWSVKNLCIDPANASNKVLRRALVKEGQSESSSDEYLFAISTIRAHLAYYSALIERSLVFYETEAGKTERSLPFLAAGTALGAVAGGSYVAQGVDQVNLSSIAAHKSTLLVGVALGLVSGYVAGRVVGKPYTKKQFATIIFLLEQIQLHINFLMTTLDDVKELSQMNEKRDQVSMTVKNLMYELAHLAFVIDADKAFDPNYRGQKLIYDATRMVLDRQQLAAKGADAAA